MENPTDVPQAEAGAPKEDSAPAPAAAEDSTAAVNGDAPSGAKKKEDTAARPAGEGGAAGGPPASNPLALRHERLQGTISKFVPTSGWGFVQSHLFEGEVGFKTESIMLECQSYEFQEGETVEFDVQSDERGRAHAVALKPMVGRKPSECLGQRQRGYVRRFADRWGFLNAAAFDGDLFVHRDNLLLAPEQMQDGMPPLRAGQAVEFDIALDDRGRTVAKQITTTALMRPCEWIGRRLHGYIRSFQGAWGFINSERFAGDLFVHRDSLLGQYQGLELSVGTMVEFDVERDHHKKGGKNRLVARQVAVLHTPNSQVGGGYGGMQNMMQPGMSSDPLGYGGMHSGMPYSQDQNLYPGYQPPYPPYSDPHYGQHMGLLGQHMGLPGQHMGLPPPVPQLGAPPPYAQQMSMPGVPPYAGAPTQHMGGQVPFPGAASYPGHPQPYGAAYPGQPGAALPADGALQPAAGVTAPEVAQATTDAAAAGGEQPQVLLHITTHDWEPDQSGQLRVRKGTLVNVSHRAAHGWVYAATVQPSGDANEPVQEGWVPQAVAKRVSLCRAAVDWPAEGSGTLGLVKGDLIAVSKEAERGWVYGERMSPRRADSTDGWLPKKVLEYLLA